MSTTMFGACPPAAPDDEGDGEPGAWLSAAPLGVTDGCAGDVDSTAAGVESGGLVAGTLAGGRLDWPGLATGPVVLAGSPLALAAGAGVTAGVAEAAGAPLATAGDLAVSPCVPVAAATDEGATEGVSVGVALDWPHAANTTMTRIAADTNIPRRAVATQGV